MKRSVTLALLLALGLGPILASANESEIGVSTNIKAKVSLNSGKGSTTSTTTGTSTKERGDDKSVVGKIKAELKGSIRADMVRANISAAAEVYKATIARLQKIITRVESRMAKVSTAGGSTTEAQAQVNLAKADIVDAQAQINIFTSVDLSTTTATSTIETNYKTARAAAVKAREDLTAAKKSLMKALQSLVKVEVGLKGSASSTASTTNQ
ncbi:hypothetical protein KW785_03150 [Candidatus Parcubacteria bacterium]|nr:hypothetical protein [Candidatus Parcubacteria bacterium]